MFRKGRNGKLVSVNHIDSLSDVCHDLTLEMICLYMFCVRFSNMMSSASQASQKMWSHNFTRFSCYSVFLANFWFSIFILWYVHRYVLCSFFCTLSSTLNSVHTSGGLLATCSALKIACELSVGLPFVSEATKILLEQLSVHVRSSAFLVLSAYLSWWFESWCSCLVAFRIHMS